VKWLPPITPRSRCINERSDSERTGTLGGEAAVAVHRGPYNRMNQAHDAIRTWMAANRRESAGQSWEIYGNPTTDPAKTETTVVYRTNMVRAETNSGFG
jgi:effector-binding domain-containing protein